MDFARTGLLGCAAERAPHTDGFKLTGSLVWEFDFSAESDVDIWIFGLRLGCLDQLVMVVLVGHDAELKNPRVGDFTFDFLDFCWIDIGDDNFDLVVASRSHDRFVHTRGIDPVENRSDEVFCQHRLVVVSDRGLIDLVDQIRATFDVGAEFQLAGGNDDSRGDNR